MLAQPLELPRRETVLDAVLYLMTKHAQAPCPVVQRAIVMHLQLLERYPSAEAGPDHRHLVRNLCAVWERLMPSSDSGASGRESTGCKQSLH